jgi:signal transduction histidine kinase/CheY-like chemotaxis protein
MKTTVEVSVVVLIAATMVMFSLLICLLERSSRNVDRDLRRGTSWLIAANIALLLAVISLLFNHQIPFWLGACAIIACAHLGILFGFFAIHSSLGARPNYEVFGAISAGNILLHGILVLLAPGVPQLFLSTSIINSVLTLIMGFLVSRLARPYGRELLVLLSLPFYLISAGYMLRLFLQAIGSSQAVLVTATALIAFTLATASLQWRFGLTALRAASLNISLGVERQRALKLADTRARFLAHMSHEIRTSLNTVLGLADVLHGLVHDKETRLTVGHIQHSGKLLVHILNDILDVSKLEVGAVSIEERPFSIDSLLVQIQASHAPKCAERGLALIVDIRPEVAGHWLGDSHRIEQILQNVIGNAIKFTETGSVRVTAKADQDLCLTVEDTGIGMTPAQVDAMFDEFSQADDDTTRRFGGTGLGMAIVRRLVTLMGGTIHVESRPGHGSKVTIVLPLQRIEVVDVAPVDSGEPKATDFGALRVLCADDTKSNILVISAMLRFLGIEPQTADDGHAAIRIAQRHDFDIYLLDISMPGFSGIETLHGLREVEKDRGRPHSCAIAVTASVLSSEVSHYLTEGFDGFLPKPIQIEALQAVLRDCQDKLSRRTEPTARAAR